MLVVNKRGTVRNIETSQLEEYKVKGYWEVTKKTASPEPEKPNDSKVNKK